MVDSKAMITQVQEIQAILHDLHAENMLLSESFQVAAIIEKLPPSQRDFKNYLMYEHKEIKLEKLMVRLGIEDNNKIAEKGSLDSVIDPRQMLLEQTTKQQEKEIFQ